VKPCRDCSTLTAASAHSCPACGIWNPVLHWVSFPDGSHRDGRAPRGYTSGGGAAAAVLSAPAGFGTRAGSPFNTASTRRPFYSLLDDRDEALQSIGYSARGFYVLSAVHVLLGLLYTPALVIGLLLGGTAFAMRRTHSQVAAGLLMLYGGYRVWDLAASAVSGEYIGGASGVFITIAILVTAYRAVDATLALNGRFRQ